MWLDIWIALLYVWKFIEHLVGTLIYELVVGIASAKKSKFIYIILSIEILFHCLFLADRYGNRIDPDVLFKEKASPYAFDLVRRLRLTKLVKEKESDEVRPLLEDIKSDKFFKEKFYSVSLEPNNYQEYGVYMEIQPAYLALSRMIPSYCFLNHSMASSRVTLWE